MTWLALATPHQGTVLRRGALADGAAEQERFLLAGSVVLEFSRARRATAPLRLLDLAGQEDWPTRLSIEQAPAGGVSVALRQGRTTSRVSVSGWGDCAGRDLRLTFSWDAPSRRGVLSLEQLDGGELHQVDFATPQPLPMTIAEQIARPRHVAGRGAIAAEVNFLGVSDRIEPVGLIAGLAQNTPIDTPGGPVPIERLQPGDQVITEDSGPQPVRWIGMREVPALGRFLPVRLRAPYFGLRRDLVVAPEQRVQIDTVEVEYLFGERRVLVEARHLVNGVSALPERHHRTLKLYHVLLDRHEVLTAAGGRVESLYIGSIADDPALLGSTILAGMPCPEAPRHSGLACHLLRPFEAMTLRSVANA